MEMTIIGIYFFSDEILKLYRFRDDPQVKITTAEIITVALTASLFFSGNQRLAFRFLNDHSYIHSHVSESRLNRRLHRIPFALWQALFSLFAEHFKENQPSKEYIVDSFPVSVCENIRIFKSKIYTEKCYRGYIASKKRYFYGIRVHLVTTAQGKPVEVIFAEGAQSDIAVFKRFNLDLPANSVIYGDRAYTCYDYEDFLYENEIILISQRRSNTRRPHLACTDYLRETCRKRIETAFSQITRLFPKSIHAVTRSGFELKVFSFILAYSFQLFLQ